MANARQQKVLKVQKTEPVSQGCNTLCSLQSLCSRQLTSDAGCRGTVFASGTTTCWQPVTRTASRRFWRGQTASYTMYRAQTVSLHARCDIKVVGGVMTRLIALFGCPVDCLFLVVLMGLKAAGLPKPVGDQGQPVSGDRPEQLRAALRQRLCTDVSDRRRRARPSRQH